MSAKITIVDAAIGVIDNEQIDGLIKFNDYLASIRLTPRDTKAGGTWVVKHKGKSVCHIRLDDTEQNWNISFGHFTNKEKWFVNYDQYITDNSLKQFVWDNIHTAPSPNSNCIKRECKGLDSITILGKTLNDVCRCVGVRVYNPNNEEIEQAKKIVLIIKQYIADLVTAS
ncbi:MAG: hypothetical protein FWE06_06245 [Oscillospiraceae bacterium]|nr:hypothetical protein [Oscillospiraceae bacterium]